MISNRYLKITFAVSFFFLVISLHAPLAGSESGTSNDQKIAAVRKLYRSYKRDFPGVVDISAAEARTLLDQEKVVFIDVREPEEQEISVLPNSVTRGKFLKDPGITRGKTAVAYCTIGHRSGVFSESMGKQGVEVVNLRGGIVAWVLDGGKVYTNGRDTNRVHVYGKEWNYLPEGYEAVMFGFFEKLLN